MRYGMGAADYPKDRKMWRWEAMHEPAHEWLTFHMNAVDDGSPGACTLELCLWSMLPGLMSSILHIFKANSGCKYKKKVFNARYLVKSSRKSFSLMSAKNFESRATKWNCAFCSTEKKIWKKKNWTKNHYHQHHWKYFLFFLLPYFSLLQFISIWIRQHSFFIKIHALTILYKSCFVYVTSGLSVPALRLSFPRKYAIYIFVYLFFSIQNHVPRKLSDSGKWSVKSMTKSNNNSPFALFIR